MEEEIKKEEPIEENGNEEINEEKKVKHPILNAIYNEVANFVDKHNYSSIAIGVGALVGVYLFVKYKRKK